MPYIFENFAKFINQTKFKIFFMSTEEFENLKKRYSELLFLLHDKTINSSQVIELFKIEKVLPRNIIINYYDIVEAEIKRKEYNTKIYNEILS